MWSVMFSVEIQWSQSYLKNINKQNNIYILSIFLGVIEHGLYYWKQHQWPSQIVTVLKKPISLTVDVIVPTCPICVMLDVICVRLDVIALSLFFYARCNCPALFVWH